jgi:hypothetical protein
MNILPPSSGLRNKPRKQQTEPKSSVIEVQWNILPPSSGLRNKSRKQETEPKSSVIKVQWNILPPSSWLHSKPGKKPARSKWQALFASLSLPTVPAIIKSFY